MDSVSKTDDGKAALSRAVKPTVSPNLLVAAIDFGTAYSGYAFSTREDFDKDPLSIVAPEWDKELKSPKTPTSILFDKEKKRVAFGNEAEKKFTELTEDEKHEEYYFFQKFKMILYESVKKGDKLTKQTELSDINGKTMMAIDVFSAAIKYLKDHLLKELKNRGMDRKLKEEDIRWVLTVPAIWDDPAKQFMRDAAEQAGIRGDCLIIALEPEVASMYCKQHRMVQSKKEIEKLEPGSRYLIMDAGGGTVDVTIHEILKDGHIKEVHSATGGAWGGTYVDKKFEEMFRDILGENVFEDYKKKNLADYMEIVRNLEIGKRNFSTTSPKFEIRLPPSLIQECSLKNKIMNSDFKEHVKYEKQKLKLDVSLVKDLFFTVCNGITDHVKTLLHDNDIKTVLMVGGFSESPFLQAKMKESFPDCHRVIPNEAGLAVLRGAVLFGHEPKVIVSRRAKYSYGVQTLTKFKEGIHPDNRKKDVDGIPYCSGVFSKHVTKDDDLKIDTPQVQKTYYPVYKDQKSVHFDVYTSTSKDPEYVDDEDCKRVGSLKVEIPDTTGGTDRMVLVRFMFGETELKVEGENVKTGEKNEVKINYFELEQCTSDQRQYCGVIS